MTTIKCDDAGLRPPVFGHFCMFTDFEEEPDAATQASLECQRCDSPTED